VQFEQSSPKTPRFAGIGTSPQVRFRSRQCKEG
jgi:hypothetical protein